MGAAIINRGLKGIAVATTVVIAIVGLKNKSLTQNYIDSSESGSNL